jgi:TolA-binding protein
LGRHSDAYAAFLTVEGRFRATKYVAYVPFWKGVLEYEQGEFQTALDRFKAVAQKPPDGETLRQSLVYLGKSATALSRIDTAISAFERLLKELSVPPLRLESEGSVLVFLSDLYGKSGSHEALIALWERIDPELLDKTSREQLTLRSAEAYLAAGQSDKALPLFESLADSPRRDISTAALTRLLEQQRRLSNESAVQAILVKAELSLRSEPDDLADFWLQVGAGAFREGRYDLARSYFLRVSALQSPEKRSSQVPVYLAEIALRENNAAEAYRILAEGAATPRDGRALILTRMGWLALSLERWDDARSAATEAITVGRGENRQDLVDLAGFYLSYALYRSELPQEALALLGTAPSQQDGSLESAVLRAELLRLTDKPVEAVAAFGENLEAPGASAGIRADTLVRKMALLFGKSQYAQVLETAAELDGPGVAQPSLSPAHRFAVAYLRGISAAAVGNYAAAVSSLDAALGISTPAPAAAVPWAAYYRAWSLYRSSRFKEALSGFTAFADTYPSHELAFNAAYLGAWSAARQSAYAEGIALAERAASIARTLPASPSSKEAEARSLYLEGILRSFLSDWKGALGAMERAIVLGSTSYRVRAAYEIALIHTLSGNVEAADAAYARVARDYPLDPLAAESAFRRGELMYSAKRWDASLERFSSYRQAFPNGGFTDGALYFSGLAQKALGKVDASILLWERLLADLGSSRYRFPASLALGRAYWEKQDWENAFKVYTSTLAEFGDRARNAGVGEDAETLRYLLARLPEKAARLHVAINKYGGAATPEGRAAAIQLARFYITETAQREAGAALAEEVLALRSQDPAAAAEAYQLKGDYFYILENWEGAALAYLESAASAGEASGAALTTLGTKVASELLPESLFKAARARARSGKMDSASEIVALLERSFFGSVFASQAKRLLEGAQ